MADLDPLLELNHYYQGCILKYPVDDVNVPFYADAFGYDKKEGFNVVGSAGIYKTGKLMWTPSSMDASLLDYTHPELGCININKTVMHVRRIPERQYKKALYEKTLSSRAVAPIISEIEGAYGVEVFKRDILNLAYHIFNQTYRPVDCIINEIEAGNLYAGAFTKDFYVYPLLSSNLLCIGYKEHRVGVIKNKKILLPSDNEYLIQELSQHMETEVIV